MEFRTDIQGLRAYAVLAVVLYHFHNAWMPGGFVGVDIFFVLSGYLMTGLIGEGLVTQRFSVTAFYLGRLRRIVPALLVLCCCLLLLGWFWLAPIDYRLLGKHAASALSFTSNILFNEEESYFDVPSQTKWLLHTWSLSVEWQFYLLYPWLLMSLTRWRGASWRTINRGLWVLGGVSLLLCILATPTYPQSSFYMLDRRAWEMIAGGLVYGHLARRPTPYAYAALREGLGIALILCSAIGFQSSMQWPGYAALLPVLGTALVLTANRQHSWLTNNAILQWLGRCSYSLYLWHWPIVVALNYSEQNQHIPFILLGIVAALLLGALSYYYVEQPARRWLQQLPNARAMRCVLISMAVIIALGVAITEARGIPQRVSKTIATIDAQADNHFTGLPEGCGFNRHTQQLTPCDLDPQKPRAWVVMGDSHAGAILGVARAALPGGIRYYSHQCATMFNAELKSKWGNNHCTGFMREAWQQIQSLPPTVGVIISNRYALHLLGPNEGTTRDFGVRYTDLGDAQTQMDAGTLYTQRLVDTLCTIAQQRRVVAVAPIPEIGVDVPKIMARQWMLGHPIRTVTISRKSYAARNAIPLAALNEAQARCGITILDPIPYLCDATHCYGARNGTPYYTDDDHLSELGNRLLLPLFATLTPAAPRP